MKGFQILSKERKERERVVGKQVLIQVFWQIIEGKKERKKKKVNTKKREEGRRGKKKKKKKKKKKNVEIQQKDGDEEEIGQLTSLPRCFFSFS
jgi:hypothetical protein